MRMVLSLCGCVLALAAFGCGSSSTDPYDQAAQEVESAVAALDQADSDNTAIDDGTTVGDAAVADDDSDSDEATDEANGGHRSMGSGDHGDRGGDKGANGDKRGGGGKHGRGHHHGRGHDLLLWYADLDALQVCRDQRDTCLASADSSTCKDDVHACVKPILDAAFAAMCEERTTMCEAADASVKGCERVAEHCGGASSPDAGP